MSSMWKPLVELYHQAVSKIMRYAPVCLQTEMTLTSILSVFSSLILLSYHSLHLPDPLLL